jgi:hypothetical protein
LARLIRDRNTPQKAVWRSRIRIAECSGPAPASGCGLEKVARAKQALESLYEYGE